MLRGVLPALTYMYINWKNKWWPALKFFDQMEFWKFNCLHRLNFEQIVWGWTGFFEVWRSAFVKKEDWKTLIILNLQTKDYKNCLILKTEDLAMATKPTKPEDWRFAFLTGKIWEDGSWWYLPHSCMSSIVGDWYIYCWLNCGWEYRCRSINHKALMPETLNLSQTSWPICVRGTIMHAFIF